MGNIMSAITLADGTVIHFTLNGNNYITDDQVGKEVLSDDNLAEFDIDGEQFTDYTCTNIWTEGGKTRFVIHEMTETEKMKKLIIEMSAMM